MMVYGDPKFEANTTELLEGLRTRVANTGPADLDGLRALLIQAGQFEQAISDFSPNGNASEHAQRITNLTATAFHAAYTRRQTELPPSQQDVRKVLDQLHQALKDTEAFSEATLTVKIPEGFEFYALYPEQYCRSAFKWSIQNRDSALDQQLVVIGIRSIGTALSALVAATLEAIGCRPRRITVRPMGSPYARKVEFPVSMLQSMQHALIVDEGPGISGSSMASVARALVASGFKHERISFLPGHDREPGVAASAEVRGWWESTRRFVTPLEELRWNGLSLVDSLAAKSCEMFGSREPFPYVDDLSGGVWREKVYRDEADWPVAATTFERLKYCHSTANGLSIFWKFSGLGAVQKGGKSCAAVSLHRMTARARYDWTPEPLGQSHGFTALPWIDGKPLCRKDANDPAVLDHVGRYLVAASGAPLTCVERAASVARLSELLYWNTKEALGEGMAQRALCVAQSACKGGQCPSYGDGHLAPHEWVRTDAGRILKFDSVGHDTDHTIIGRQPVLWDVAGAMVEWGLSQASCLPLLAAVETFGITLCPKALSFFRMSYAAFRMGQFFLCAEVCGGDEAERARSQRAYDFYRADLLGELLRPR